MLKNKNILITGGAGFIGSRLSKKLVANNKVRAFDLMRRDAVSKTELAKNPNFSLIKGDVRDQDAVKKALKGVTHIIHLASIAGVDTVINNPLLTMEVSIKGTFNVLEAAVETKSVERFIDFSTSEVFGSFAYRVNEGDVTALGAVGEARWTYAVSKLATEHLSYVMYKQFGLKTVAIRPFNIFGPGQVGEGAIHAFIIQALKNETLQVHNGGEQIRAWCYIDDLIDGLLVALEHPDAPGKTFNLGNPSTAVTVYQLAKIIVSLTKSKSEIKSVDWPHPDVDLRIPDISRAKKLLGFMPKFDLEAGLKETIDWYSKN